MYTVQSYMSCSLMEFATLSSYFPTFKTLMILINNEIKEVILNISLKCRYFLTEI